MKRVLASLIVAAVGAFAVASSTARAVEPTADPSGNEAVSERLARMAQLSLQSKPIDDDNWRQSHALLRAAVRIRPDEPRFSRLLVDTALQIDDTDGAVAAMELYLKSRPNDQLAKVQLIDLYLSQMETSDKRLAYLNDQIIDNAEVPKEIRSAAAVRAIRLYFDRDQQLPAFAMIDRAVELEPLNPDAAAFAYQKASAIGTNVERVTALVRMLRSNPAQPSAMARLGDELANVGAHELAQQWYAKSFELSVKMNQQAAEDSYVNAASSALILGQAKTAEARALMLLAGNSLNFDAHLVRMMSIRRLGTSEQANQALSDLTLVLVERANNVHRALNEGADPPSTQPSGGVLERIPNPMEQARILKELGDAQLLENYADTLTNLAWTQIALANDQAVGAQLIEAIKQIVPPDSVVVARLEGWSLMAAGRNDEARTKLSAVADRDPISKMALIMMSTDRAQAEIDARELLSQHPSGILGAMLAGGFADLDVRAAEGEAAVAIRKALDELPAEWLKINDEPSEYYTLTAETQRVSHGFGEPMIVTVTIKNTSKFDIPFGPTGTIRPDLWFDCSVKGMVNQNVPGVMFDRMGGKLILRRNEAVTQVSRVDQGQLWQMMQGQPQMAFPLFFSVFTNPAPASTVAAPGPGGYRVQFRKPLERTGSSLFDQKGRQEVFNRVALGKPGEKIRLAEMFAQFTQIMRNQTEQDMKESVTLLQQAVEQGMGEADPNVRAWAGYVTTLLSEEPRRTELATRLAGSRDWLSRLFVSASAEGLPPETREALLQKLSTDPDPIVAEHAAATMVILRRAPTTQPTEGDGPAGGAGN